MEKHFNRHMDLKKLAAAVLIVASSSVPALAQFIGFVSPQSVQQQLGAAHQPCTAPAPGFPNGQLQEFTVQNLGQTEHYLTVAADNSNATHFSATLIGVTATGARVIISDSLEMAGLITGSLYANGYFPKVLVDVFCTPTTATYTLSYSGVTSTAAPQGGTFEQSRIDKLIFNGQTSVGNVLVDNLIPPFGSSAGFVFFRFVSAPAAGSTLAVSCQNAQGSGFAWNVVVLPAATLASSTTMQDFQVPNFPCPQMQVSYNGAGGPAVIAYAFATGGFSNWPIDSGTPVAP